MDGVEGGFVGGGDSAVCGEEDCGGELEGSGEIEEEGLGLCAGLGGLVSRALGGSGEGRGGVGGEEDDFEVGGQERGLEGEDFAGGVALEGLVDESREAVAVRNDGLAGAESGEDAEVGGEDLIGDEVECRGDGEIGVLEVGAESGGEGMGDSKASKGSGEGVGKGGFSGAVGTFDRDENRHTSPILCGSGRESRERSR